MKEVSTWSIGGQEKNALEKAKRGEHAVAQARSEWPSPGNKRMGESGQ